LGQHSNEAFPWFFDALARFPGLPVGTSSRITRPEEDARMIPAAVFNPRFRVAVLVILFSLGLLFAQEQQATNFYDVQLSKDEVYSYNDLKFAGDYTSFESFKGFLVLGKTQAGVTIVIVIGEGTMSIEAPEAVQEKFKTVMGVYPLKTTFKNLYMRIHPKEYEETFGKQSLTKVADESAFNGAKQLFDDRFTSSYHAGPKALLPPYKTHVMDFNTATLGLVTTTEGYWLILRKYSPYGSVYPSDFVNPKQK
jgi:hypothetical protein